MEESKHDILSNKKDIINLSNKLSTIAEGETPAVINVEPIKKNSHGEQEEVPIQNILGK